MTNGCDIAECVFCGSEDVFINFKADYTKYWVQCKNCTAHGSWCNSGKEAIEAWNRGYDKFRFDSE